MSPTPRRLLALAGWITVAGWTLVAGWPAQPASADVEYSYSNLFQFTSGCPTDSSIEVSLVLEDEIPPNTPLPSPGAPEQQPLVDYSFSACGVTCSNDTTTCRNVSYRFGTTAGGSVDEWEVGADYTNPGGEDITIATTLRVLDGVEGDLFWNFDTGDQAGSAQVASWTVMPEPGSAAGLVGGFLLLAALPRRRGLRSDG